MFIRVGFIFCLLCSFKVFSSTGNNGLYHSSRSESKSAIRMNKDKKKSQALEAERERLRKKKKTKSMAHKKQSVKKSYIKDRVELSELDKQQLPWATIYQLHDICISEKIKSVKQYGDFYKIKGGVFNNLKLPANPVLFYKEKWTSWNDILFRLENLTHEEFLRVVPRYISSSSQFSLWRAESGGVINGKKIPANPHIAYKGEWQGWDYVFGKEIMEYLTLEELIEFVLKDPRINSSTDYYIVKQQDNSIVNGKKMPSNPHHFYGDQWPSWKSIFKDRMDFLTYEELMEAIPSSLKKSTDFSSWRNRVGGVINGKKIPANPHVIYKDQWPGWIAALGRAPFIPHEGFSEFLIKEGIQSGKEYREKRVGLQKKLGGEWRLPTNPNIVYGDQWKGWDVALGKALLMPYNKFPAFLAQEGIQSGKEYAEKRLELQKKLGGEWRLPGRPEEQYKTQWKGWRTTLKKVSKIYNKKPPFIPYEGILSVFTKAGIQSGKEYYERKDELEKKLNGKWRLPARPRDQYKDQWPGWDVALKKIPKQFALLKNVPLMPYEKLRAFLIEEGISLGKEYAEKRLELQKKLGDEWRLPTTPSVSYKGQWQGWELELKKPSSKKESSVINPPTMPWGRFKNMLVRENIKSEKDYNLRRLKLEKKLGGDLKLPTNPDDYYKDKWPGWELALNKDALSYYKFSEFLQKEGISSIEEYYEKREELGKKLKEKLPINPSIFYKSEWESWDVTLGKKCSDAFKKSS